MRQPKCVNCVIGWWAYIPLFRSFMCRKCGHTVTELELNDY